MTYFSRWFSVDLDFAAYHKGNTDLASEKKERKHYLSVLSLILVAYRYVIKTHILLCHYFSYPAYPKLSGNEP